MAGDFNTIKLDASFQYEEIVSLKIRKEMNHHVSAKVVVLINKESAEKLPAVVNEESIIKIIQQEKDTEIIMFCGVPQKLSIRHTDGDYYLKLKLLGSTIKMDYQKKRRSFQNKQNTYQNLFSKIIKQEYSGDFIDNASNDSTLNRTIIQYDETDWDFLKRLASQLGAGLVPAANSQKVKLWIGLPQTDVKKVPKGSSFETFKILDEYRADLKSGMGGSETNYIGYRIESYDYFELGKEVIFDGKEFMISRVISEIKEGLFIHEYRLQNKNALAEAMRYNKNIKGVSIKGTVLKVDKDKMKVHLAIDKEQKIEDADWFPFSGMYMAEGSTGWYCMPEEGSTVYLYLPGSDEDQGLIRGVVRTDGGKNTKTESPSSKYMGNSYGKEMKQDAEEVKFTCKEGKLYLTLNASSGITMQSNSDVEISSGSEVLAFAHKISISAKEKFVLETKTSSIVMDNSTHLKGNQIVQNGTIKR